MNAVRKEPVFFSFHFDNDVMRMWTIRNIGVVEGDEPVGKGDWERIKQTGDAAVEAWIDENMKYRRCVIVLIGAETYGRKWVQYEIKKAWEEKRGLFGIYIDDIKCTRTRSTCARGSNPFDYWQVNGTPMSRYITTYTPDFFDAYGDISRNLSGWVATAIAEAQNRR